MSIEELANLSFGHCADKVIRDRAVFEQHDSRQATHAHLACKSVFFVGIDLVKEEETLTAVSAENDYGRFFPMVHLRYELTELTNFRAAVTTAIARPNFVDLVPFRVVDDEDITIGNPDLDPTTSTNFDLLVEHYDRRIGVMSAGFFWKSLNDPIFPFTEDNELGGNTVQPRNIDDGEILGV